MELGDFCFLGTGRIKRRVFRIGVVTFHARILFGFEIPSYFIVSPYFKEKPKKNRLNPSQSNLNIRTHISKITTMHGLSTGTEPLFIFMIVLQSRKIFLQTFRHNLYKFLLLSFLTFSIFFLLVFIASSSLYVSCVAVSSFLIGVSDPVAKQKKKEKNEKKRKERRAREERKKQGDIVHKGIINGGEVITEAR